MLLAWGFLLWIPHCIAMEAAEKNNALNPSINWAYLWGVTAVLGFLFTLDGEQSCASLHTCICWARGLNHQHLGVNLPSCPSNYKFIIKFASCTALRVRQSISGKNFIDVNWYLLSFCRSGLILEGGFSGISHYGPNSLHLGEERGGASKRRKDKISVFALQGQSCIYLCPTAASPLTSTRPASYHEISVGFQLCQIHTASWMCFGAAFPA